MSRDRNGSRNSNWKGGLHDIVCQECGTVFQVKYGRKDTARFCSLACYGAYNVTHRKQPAYADRIITADAPLPKIDKEGTREIWRSVANTEGLYRVSSHGAVQSKCSCHGSPRAVWQTLRPWLRGGYPAVKLYVGSGRQTRTVHSLVMEAFAGPRPDGLEINHMDGNRTNNYVENLEYVTHAQNVTHAAKHGLKPRILGSRSPNAKLTEEDVMEIKRILNGPACDRISHSKLGSRFGVGKGAISGIATKRSWSHL